MRRAASVLSCLQTQYDLLYSLAKLLVMPELFRSFISLLLSPILTLGGSTASPCHQLLTLDHPLGGNALTLQTDARCHSNMQHRLKPQTVQQKVRCNLQLGRGATTNKAVLCPFLSILIFIFPIYRLVFSPATRSNILFGLVSLPRPAFSSLPHSQHQHPSLAAALLHIPFRSHRLRSLTHSFIHRLLASQIDRHIHFS